jgi:hypothetical protein
MRTGLAAIDAAVLQILSVFATLSKDPLLPPDLGLTEGPQVLLLGLGDLDLVTGLSQGRCGNIWTPPRDAHKKEAAQVRVLTQSLKHVGLLVAECELGRRCMLTQIYL